MFDRGLILSGVSVLVLSLSGCGTPGLYPKPGMAYVQNVVVTQNANEKIPNVAAALRNQIIADAAALPQQGKPIHIAVNVETYHLKNPALALLVGDENRMSGTVEVDDPTLPGPRRKVPVITIDSYGVNGVIGAVQAAAQSPSDAESRVTRGFSINTIEKLFGTKSIHGLIVRGGPKAGL